MVELRQAIGISFSDLELDVFRRLREAFSAVMESVLDLRDKSRYVVKDFREASVPTLLGDVAFKRRYYFDKETGAYVHLLDEALGFEGGRVSPGLAITAALQAVLNPSYRAARDSLRQFYGHQVISHETIRQLVLMLGDMVEKEERERRDDADGKRRVPVIFVEADGYWVSMQKCKKDRREVRMIVAHEGWQPKTPGSREYDLIHKTHYLEMDGDSSDFWENASRHLYSRYDIDEETLVVLNGDRASWIRKGIEYFPNAIYQVDRFHLKRDLRLLLRGSKKDLRDGLRAVEENDVKSLAAALRNAQGRTPNLDYVARMSELLSSIREMPESYRDYRVRLREKGYDVTGLRGMGAAESNVDRFSNRLKKRGQSWGLQGLKAMIHSLVKSFEGKLEHYVRHVSKIHNLLSSKETEECVKSVVKKVKDEVLRVKHGNTPMKNAGVIRSGGMSKMLWSLDYNGSLLK